jgi:hypothetical protein
MKTRIRPDTVVVNPLDATRHRCGLRLSLGPNASFLSCSETPVLAYKTRSTRKQTRPGRFQAGKRRAVDESCTTAAYAELGACKNSINLGKWWDMGDMTPETPFRR